MVNLYAVRDAHGLWLTAAGLCSSSDVGEVAWVEEPGWLSLAFPVYAESGLHRKTLPSKVFGVATVVRFGVDDNRLLIDFAIWPRRSNADAAAGAFEKVGLPRPPVLEGRVSWAKV